MEPGENGSDVSDVMVETGAATQAPDAAPEASESLDWFLDEKNPPGMVQALQAELKDGAGSFKVPRPNLESLDPDTQKFIVNLRNHGHTKANEAAAARREAAAAAAKLEEERAALAVERQKVYGVLKDPLLLEMLKPTQEVEPDPYKDPGAYAKWHGAQGAKQVVADLLTRFGQASDGAQKAAAEAMAKIEEAKQEAAAEAFVKDHLEDFQQPGFFDLVEKLVQTHNYSLTDAYEYAMFKSGRQIVAKSAQQEAADPRAAMRIPGPSRSNGTLPPTPTNLDVYQLQEWYDRNPGTRERDAQEYARSVGFA